MKLVKDGGFLQPVPVLILWTMNYLPKPSDRQQRMYIKDFRQVEYRTQAPDHPILWAADESYYLKFIIFQVVDEK